MALSGVSNSMINQISRSQNMMNLYSRQLASGTRLVSASVDPAGMAISSKMTSQIRGFEAAGKNVSAATGMLETAEGGTKGIKEILAGLKEAVIAAGNGTGSLTDINAQIASAKSDIDSIISSTEYNGKKILKGDMSSAWIQTGPNSGQGLSLSISDLSSITDDLTAMSAVDSSGIDTILGAIDDALDTVTSTETTIGSSMNRMEHVQKYIDASHEALSSANSRIADVDEAKASLLYNKESLKQQASILMLGNMMQQQGMLLNLLA